jgi:hypothetical protein
MNRDNLKQAVLGTLGERDERMLKVVYGPQPPKDAINDAFADRVAELTGGARGQVLEALRVRDKRRQSDLHPQRCAEADKAFVDAVLGAVPAPRQRAAAGKGR